jgi:hypothetical protein
MHHQEIRSQSTLVPVAMRCVQNDVVGQVLFDFLQDAVFKFSPEWTSSLVDRIAFDNCRSGLRGELTGVGGLTGTRRADHEKRCGSLHEVSLAASGVSKRLLIRFKGEDVGPWLDLKDLVTPEENFVLFRILL